MDINEILHLGRTRYLAQMPKVERTILSAGCSGTWYFNWIDDNYGRVERHLGVEYYSPKPSDLPEYAQWIANTVSNMENVPSGSVELVFSGQNVEHLWPEDLVGFLVESHRVLEASGHLVVDSPNRLLAEALKWSHPEHTVELTANEMLELLRLAGFESRTVKAIWSCRDSGTGELLALEPSGGQTEIEERLLRAGDEADDCLIWWIEAVKADRAPDESALSEKVDAIYAEAWPKRWRRAIVPDHPGLRSREEGDARKISSLADYNGPIAFGPYIPLRAGRYNVTLNLSAEGPRGRDAVARCDVIDAQQKEILVRLLSLNDLRDCGGEVTLSFTLHELHFGIQVRCFSFGKTALTLTLPIDHEEEASQPV